MGFFTSKQEDKFRAFAKANGASRLTALLYSSTLIRAAKQNNISPDVLLNQAQLDFQEALPYDPQMFKIANTLPDAILKLTVEGQANMIINQNRIKFLLNF